MILNYDIETDYLFQQGIEKGIQRGIEKGIERGIEKGIERGKAKGEIKGQEKQSIIAIRNMFKKNFETEDIADLIGIKLSFVEKIKKDLLIESKILKALNVKRVRYDSIAKKLKVHPLLVKILREELKKNQKK